MKRKYSLKNEYASTEINDAVLTLSEPDRAKIEWPLQRNVFRILFLASFGMLLLFTVRFLYLNVYEGERYQEMSAKNSVRSVVIPAPRGFILDRYGESLVNNIPSIDLVLTPVDIPTDGNEVAKLKEELKSLQVTF